MEIDTSDESEAAEFEIETAEGWQTVSTYMLPTKSKLKYEKIYDSFRRWLEKAKGCINEKSLLSYFVERSHILRSPNSMGTEYSILKVMISLKNGVNIGDFRTLTAFLKKKNVGHTPKKSKIFLREDINTFLTKAPDETYLMMKVAMIIGIAGACRRDELTNLTINDIDDRGSAVIIKIPNSNTNRCRTFSIIDSPDEEVNLLEILRRYLNLRPKKAPSPRFFYRFSSGKCVNQVVGINTMGRLPSNIAKFLKLKDPLLYTGCAFRRTSAALMDAGSGILTLKKRRTRYSFTQIYQEEPIQNETQCPNNSFNENSNTSVATDSSASASFEIAISSTPVCNTSVFTMTGNTSLSSDSTKVQTNSAGGELMPLLNSFDSSVLRCQEMKADGGGCVLEEMHPTGAEPDVSASKQNNGTVSVDQISERKDSKTDFEMELFKKKMEILNLEKEFFKKKMEILDLEKETKMNELENSRLQLEHSRIRLDIIQFQKARLIDEK